MSSWRRHLLLVAAVLAVFVGGFVYDEVGPHAFGIGMTLLASLPLLLTLSFWKKILLMIPLLLLRVIGKILFKVFGLDALSRILARNGPLEQRVNRMLDNLQRARQNAFLYWKSIHRESQSYLILIFLPLAIVLVLISLLIELIRLKFLRILIEKMLQVALERHTVYRAAKKAKQIQSSAVNDDNSNHSA